MLLAANRKPGFAVSYVAGEVPGEFATAGLFVSPDERVLGAWAGADSSRYTVGMAFYEVPVFAERELVNMVIKSDTDAIAHEAFCRAATPHAAWRPWTALAPTAQVVLYLVRRRRDAGDARRTLEAWARLLHH